MWMKGQREVVWGRKEEGDFVIKSRQTECSLVYLWRYWLGPFYLSGPAGLLRYPPDLFSNFKYCHFFFIFRRIELAVQYCVVFRIQRLRRRRREKKLWFIFVSRTGASIRLCWPIIHLLHADWMASPARARLVPVIRKIFFFSFIFLFFWGIFPYFSSSVRQAR